MIFETATHTLKIDDFTDRLLPVCSGVKLKFLSPNIAKKKREIAIYTMAHEMLPTKMMMTMHFTPPQPWLLQRDVPWLHWYAVE